MTLQTTPQRQLNLLTLSIAAVGIQALMLSPLLTDIAQGLSTGAKEIGFAAGAYGVGVAAAAFLAAPRLGVWPKRTAIRISFLGLAIGLVICAAATGWPMLAAGQLLVGLVTGVIIPSTYALTGDVAAPAERSRATGRVLFGWSIAMVAGVPLAAILSSALGWRGTFLAVAAIALAMVAGGALLPDSRESATGTPVSYRQALRIPGAIVGYIATFAYMIGFYQTYTFLGDHVRTLHHAGAWLGGVIALTYGVGFGAGVSIDRWIDRKGPRNIMPLGLSLVALNYVALPLAADHLWVIAVYPLVWGFVNHLCMTTLVSFLSSLSEEKRGAIMGLFSFTTYVSLGTAGAIYGTVYENHGLWAVSLAATLQLAAAAILVKLAFSPDRRR